MRIEAKVNTQLNNNMKPKATPTEAEYPNTSRPEVVLAGLIIMMNGYRNQACPHVADCVLKQLNCLASHAGADPLLRNLACELKSEWCALARIGEDTTPNQTQN